MENELTFKTGDLLENSNKRFIPWIFKISIKAYDVVYCGDGEDIIEGLNLLKILEGFGLDTSKVLSLAVKKGLDRLFDCEEGDYNEEELSAYKKFTVSLIKNPLHHLSHHLSFMIPVDQYIHISRLEHKKVIHGNFFVNYCLHLFLRDLFKMKDGVVEFDTKGIEHKKLEYSWLYSQINIYDLISPEDLREGGESLIRRALDIRQMNRTIRNIFADREKER
ncbi:MAG: hypothetical protein QXO73_07090 [Archaeoglobaceae archaeon]